MQQCLPQQMSLVMLRRSSFKMLIRIYKRGPWWAHLGVLSCLDGREKAGRDGLRYVHVGAQRAFTGLQHA